MQPRTIVAEEVAWSVPPEHLARPTRDVLLYLAGGGNPGPERRTRVFEIAAFRSGHDFKPKGARRFRGFLRKPDQSPSPSLPRAYYDRHSMIRHQKPPTRTHLVPSLDWSNLDKVACGDIRASASSFSSGCLRRPAGAAVRNNIPGYTNLF